VGPSVRSGEADGKTTVTLPAGGPSAPAQPAASTPTAAKPAHNSWRASARLARGSPLLSALASLRLGLHPHRQAPDVDKANGGRPVELVPLVIGSQREVV